MIHSKTYKKMLLAQLALTLKNHELAFVLLTKLNEDSGLKKNLYLYSRVLFGLAICLVMFERYDVAYVQFMKANTIWPHSNWATFSSENAAFCIEKLGGETLAWELFHKNTKAGKSTDNFLSLAYHAYYLSSVREKALNKGLERAQGIGNIIPSQKTELTEAAYEQSMTTALKTSYFYLNHADTVSPDDIAVLKFFGNLHQEMNDKGIKDWQKNENILFKLADYYRKEKQPHKAQKIYHSWFDSIEKNRLAEGKRVSMLCLLDYEAECYEEMGCPEKAIEVIQRQAKLFSYPSKKRQELLDETIKETNGITLELTERKKQLISPEVRDKIRASLFHWQSNPNIRPGIGSLRFFTLDEVKTKSVEEKGEFPVSTV